MPATGFDALVAATGAAYAITYDLTSPTVNSLTFSSANTVFKFSRNGNATLTVQNTLSLAAGTFSNSSSAAASTNALSAGSFAESGGTMTWQTGQFAVAGTVTIAGGTFQTLGNAGPNAPIVTAGALSLSGTGQFNMVNGTVTVTGLAQFNATATQLITGLLTAGTIVVGATDTLDLNAASDTLTAGAGGLSILGTLAGIGTIAGAISGTGTIQALGANFIDPNVLEITGNIAAGVVLAIGTIANSSTVSSALQIDATAEALSALSMSSFLQTLKVAAAGTLTIDQTQTVSGSALIRLAGGTLADASGIVLGVIGSANVSTIEGYGTVAAAISNGAGTDPGGFVIANGGLLDLTGSIGANIALQVQSTVASTLKLDGTVVSTFSVGDSPIDVAITSANQTLEIGASALVTINSVQSVAAGAIQLDGGTLIDTSGIVLGNDTVAGTIRGSGTILTPITTGGIASGNVIAAMGGTLSLIGSIGSAITLAIGTATASTLQIGNTDSVSAAVAVNNANQTLRIINTGQLTIGTVETIAAGSLVLAGGNLIDLSGIVLGNGIAAGRVTGFGGILGTVVAGGGGSTITATGGSIILASGVGTGIALNVDTGSYVKLDSTIGAGDIVTFLNSIGNTGTILLANGTAATSFAANATVAGMAVGTGFAVTDIVDFRAVAPGSVGSATVGTVGTTVTIWSGASGTGSNLGQFTLSAPTTGFASFQSDGLGGTNVFLVCFAGGTGIRTPFGDVAVEALRPGDKVAVKVDGLTRYRDVVWVGFRHLDLTDHPFPELVAPIRICRDAIGPGLPAKDLLVSPDHCLFLDDKLVPAKLLLNGMTVVRDTAVRSVSYYHVELANHGILLAEGLPVESYLDTGNRAFFANAGLALLVHPEFHVNAGLRCWETDACAPLAVSQTVVAPIWRRIADRAEALGHAPPLLATTAEADVHLLVDGKAVYPVAVHRGRHSFALPRGARSVRLMSRADIPGDLIPALDDWRRLGVRVNGMTLRIGDDWHDIPADHPSLRQGWHTAERDSTSLWRWTDGDALLPLERTDGPAILDIAIEGGMSYRLAPPWSRQLLAA